MSFTEADRRQIHAAIEKLLGIKPQPVPPESKHPLRPGQRVRGLCRVGGCEEARVNKSHCALHRDLAAAKMRMKLGASFYRPRGRPMMIAGHMPWLPATPKPLGAGAALPDHRRRVGDGRDPEHGGYAPVAERRRVVGQRPNTTCGFCREAGHNRSTCPELAALRGGR